MNYGLFITRCLVLPLIVFEALNYFSALKFTPDFTWLGLLITSLAVTVFFEITILKTGRPKNALILGYLLAVIVLYADAGGDIFHGYSTFTWYDQMLHYLGGLAVAVTISAILESDQIKKISSSNLEYFFIAGGSTLFMVLYEMEEYLEDYFTGSQRLGDGPDTANDLMLGLFGAISFITILYARRLLHRSDLRQTPHQN